MLQEEFDSAFLDYIQQLWHLTDVTAGVLLSNKNGRIVHQIQAREGMFTLKILSPQTTARQVNGDTSVLIFLNAQAPGMAPRLILTGAGCAFARYNDQFLYLLSFIDGVHPEWNDETFSLLGARAADLHLLSGYTRPWSIDPIDELRQARLRAQQYPTALQTDFLALIDKLPDFNKLPQGLVHTDIGPHNALHNANNILTFIDWDGAGIGPTLFDLAYPLIDEFIRDEQGELFFATTWAHAFFSQYQSRHPLTTMEQELLVDAAIFWGIAYSACYEISNWWRYLKFVRDHRHEIEAVIAIP